MSEHQPITIVHIITSLGVGGAERVLSSIVLGMERSKFRNIVISLQDLGFWGPKLKDQGIEVYALDMKPSFSFIIKLIALRKLLIKLKPDYVQGWMYHANIVALLAGKLAGVKQIFWNIRCSLMDLSQYRFTTNLIFKSGAWLAKYPSCIINNSHESMRQHITVGYKNKNNLCIPNGFDTDLFCPNEELYQNFRHEHKLPHDATIIGMVARYDPMKDHATFLRAAGMLSKDVPNVYFVCAGRNINWQNKELISIIHENDLDSRVLLLDQVNNLHELYPAFDYLTQTSIFGEGFPNVVAEAMACGVPCIVTDVGDSLVVIGDSGFETIKQDPQSLCDIWKKILQISEPKLQHKSAARNRIIDNFSLNKSIARYQAIYEGNWA